jgi:hypothetical protein
MSWKLYIPINNTGNYRSWGGGVKKGGKSSKARCSKV